MGRNRISTIVSESERNINIIDEKNFIYKFSFLLSIIVILSAYIIVQGFDEVNELSMPYENRVSNISLEMVEREINGNSIDLAVIEDDFSELSSLDLSGISNFEPVEKQEMIKQEQTHVQTFVPDKDLTVQQKKKSKKKVFITSQNADSLSFIKKKFYATNNAAFSIQLAKKFYQSKKYEQALKWSLITNEIDSKSEDSWIMFAKIKAKMGKKQDAINALNEYLKYEKSAKATALLKEIKKSIG